MASVVSALNPALVRSSLIKRSMYCSSAETFALPVLPAGAGVAAGFAEAFGVVVALGVAVAFGVVVALGVRVAFGVVAGFAVAVALVDLFRLQYRAVIVTSTVAARALKPPNSVRHTIVVSMDIRRVGFFIEVPPLASCSLPKHEQVLCVYCKIAFACVL